MPKDETTMSFSANVVEVDEHWIGEQPLELAIRFGKSQEWVWPEVAVVRDGRQVHINLVGKPQIERV